MPKCEILVREKLIVGTGMTLQDQIEVVELYKRFDGDPGRMFDWFKKFCEWVQVVANTEPATVLKDANITASLMIVFDMQWTEEFYSNYPDQKPGAIFPDVRPRGNIEDAEYLYVVDLPLKEDTVEGVWRIRVRCWYMVEHNSRYIELIHDGKAPPQKAMEREEIFELERTNEIVSKMRGTPVAATATAVLEAARESLMEDLTDEQYEDFGEGYLPPRESPPLVGKPLKSLTLKEVLEKARNAPPKEEFTAEEVEMIRELSKDPGFSMFVIESDPTPKPKRKK